MSDIKASDLPLGTVVMTDSNAFTKAEPDHFNCWRRTAGGYYSDRYVQVLLDEGARVFREGES